MVRDNSIPMLPQMCMENWCGQSSGAQGAPCRHTAAPPSPAPCAVPPCHPPLQRPLSQRSCCAPHFLAAPAANPAARYYKPAVEPGKQVRHPVRKRKQA